MKIPDGNYSGHQQGAMLFTSLGILLVITILVSSAVSLTSNEQKSAVNNQAASLAFHASESAINAAIKDETALFAAAQTGTHELDVDLGNTQITSKATISLVGSGTASGFSLGVGSGTFGAYQFEVVGEGSVIPLPSKAESVQGFYKIAPGG